LRAIFDDKTFKHDEKKEEMLEFRCLGGCKSKDRQYNAQQTKNKETYNHPQNTTLKTKD